MKRINVLIACCLLIACHKNTRNKKESTLQIERDGVQITHRLSGKGDTTLLFIHGAFIDQTYWKDQCNYFSNNYIVVTVDLPGHGSSGRNRDNWTMQGFAADVLQVIKKLNLKNVILIGHSMAGDINLIAASQIASPVIGFIGIDNFKDAATPLPEKYKPVMDSIQRSLEKDFENTNENYVRMALVTPQTPEEVTKRVVYDFRNAYKPMALGVMKELSSTYEMEKELLPKLAHKLYLINVDYFPTDEEPLKKYAGAGYNLIQLTGTSHYPMIEIPAELNHAIQTAIYRIGRG